MSIRLSYIEMGTVHAIGKAGLFITVLFMAVFYMSHDGVFDSVMQVRNLQEVIYSLVIIILNYLFYHLFRSLIHLTVRF